jgi:hypothetical protein
MNLKRPRALVALLVLSACGTSAAGVSIKAPWTSESTADPGAPNLYPISPDDGANVAVDSVPVVLGVEAGSANPDGYIFAVVVHDLSGQERDQAPETHPTRDLVRSDPVRVTAGTEYSVVVTGHDSAGGSRSKYSFHFFGVRPPVIPHPERVSMAIEGEKPSGSTRGSVTTVYDWSVVQLKVASFEMDFATMHPGNGFLRGTVPLQDVTVRYSLAGVPATAHLEQQQQDFNLGFGTVPGDKTVTVPAQSAALAGLRARLPAQADPESVSLVATTLHPSSIRSMLCDAYSGTEDCSSDPLSGPTNEAPLEICGWPDPNFSLDDNPPPAGPGEGGPECMAVPDPPPPGGPKMPESHPAPPSH